MNLMKGMNTLNMFIEFVVCAVIGSMKCMGQRAMSYSADQFETDHLCAQKLWLVLVLPTTNSALNELGKTVSANESDIHEV